MKYVFSFILLFHGLIHLLGFLKAFNLAEINQLSQNISKPIGTLWLLTFLLFVITCLAFIKSYNFWFVIAFGAVIISQILIILFWKDAKFGTLANALILIVSLSSYAIFQFDNMVEKETNEILQGIQNKALPIISENDILHLPKIVQKWLINSGVIGQKITQTIQLKQNGKMRTKPNSKWMPFTATQTFNVENLAFIWDTKVETMPLISLYGRDKLFQGEGSMIIKLGALIPIVNEDKNNKVNSGAMIRFLAEMCWVPSAALNNYIVWETLDEHSAKATLTIKDSSVSGVFKFSKEGNITSFEAKRFYGGKTDSKLETWYVEMTSFKTFNNIKIPNKSSVSWKLKEGDFNWLNLEILELKSNFKTSTR
jgi:hypothetical protein